MSKGCAKADRNRKSVQNTHYKISNRLKTNKERRKRREEKRQAKKSARYFDGKIKERGLTRKLRRKHGQKAQRTHSTGQQKQPTTPLSGIRDQLKARGYTS